MWKLLKMMLEIFIGRFIYFLQTVVLRLILESILWMCK